MSTSSPRFRLDRELESGSTGRVFHGVLLAPFGAFPAGHELAVKYLHPALEEDPRARRAFDVEAEAGSATAHPHLVHVIHAGVDARGRYVALTFVPGISLRQALEREQGPLVEPTVRNLARQVAAGLAALHAAGFVHGDLKPENIRLDAEGNAVLLDLGFARRASEAHAHDGRAVAARPGSLPYVAPEQARGESGTEKSDVFALGVVLYEIATARHPFVSFAGHDSASDPTRSARDRTGSSGLVARAALDQPDADRLLAAIATPRFVPPSRFVPRVSPFLDRVLEDALERDPARRPTAAEIAERFREGEGGAWWRTAIDFEAGARRGGTGEIDPRSTTPFVGREAPLQELLEAFEAAVQGGSAPGRAGGVAWVRGRAGSGKTRLVHEFAARARARHEPPLYLYGRCRDLEDERPCGPILRMLERFLRLPGGAAPRAREREELAQLVPADVAESLVRALDPVESAGAGPALSSALSTWLSALARRMPLVVCLDDVNWAGEGTLSVLSHVSRSLAGARLLLVVVQQDGGKVRAASALEILRERLGAVVPVRTIAIGALDLEAVLGLVRQVFHHSAPRLRLARVLWERSRGNPGLLVEILRGLVTRDLARPHATHDGDPGLDLLISPDDLPLPGSLNRAIADSYRRLPAQDRLWLRRLAVVGGRIETDFLLAAFPKSRRVDVDDVLARLVRSGWLAPSGARYRFARPALREAVYRTLSRDQRVKLHGLAAAALAPRDGAEGTAEDAFQRAFHLRAAEDHSALLAVLPALVLRFVTSGQPQRVHPLSQWGLASLAKVPRTKESDRLRIDLLEAAADASDRLGIREDQRAVLDQLSDLDFDPDSEPESVGRVYLLHGRYAVSTGQYGLARGMLRGAVLMFERAGKWLERAESLRRLSLVQSHVGELAGARQLAEESLAGAQSDAQRALAHLALGVIDVLEDHVEPALEHADQALALMRADPRAGKPGIFAAAHLLRARIYRSMGDPARALASASRAVRLAQVAGERRLETEAGARLGGMLVEADRIEEAEARLRESLLLAEEIEDRRGQGLTRLFLGILLWENGDPEAGPMLARAAELALEMGLNRIEALAAAIRARSFREAGLIEPALTSSAHAVDLVERFGAELLDRIAILGTRVLVLTSADRGDEARALQSRLVERLDRENARIRSPLVRLRQRRAAERLLAAVLSPDGPVYPRIRLTDG